VVQYLTAERERRSSLFQVGEIPHNNKKRARRTTGLNENETPTDFSSLIIIKNEDDDEDDDDGDFVGNVV
jgi:hypothetical protein